jgi:hypothetical protein
MNRTILSIIVAGLFTGLAGTIAAQNVTAGDKPPNPPAVSAVPTDPMAKSPKAVVDPKEVQATAGEPGAKVQRPAMSAKQPRAKGTEPTANAAGKADYTAAKDKARVDYNEAKAKCDAMQGDAMRTCMTEAKAARTQALAEAKMQWQGRKGGADAGAGGMKGPGPETKSDLRPGMDAAPGTSKPAGGMKPVQGNGAPGAAPDRRAGNDAIQARYEEAMAKCGPLDVAARHNCMMVADRARKEALADPDWQHDSQGGRLEKSRDDSIVPDAEKFQNVSTARKAHEDVGAAKPGMN